MRGINNETIVKEPSCHRIRYDRSGNEGHKGNKRNQTRTEEVVMVMAMAVIFVLLSCQNDWWKEHGTRAVDHAGRINSAKESNDTRSTLGIKLIPTIIMLANG